MEINYVFTKCVLPPSPQQRWEEEAGLAHASKAFLKGLSYEIDFENVDEK
jgi:hypothetical protein